MTNIRTIAETPGPALAVSIVEAGYDPGRPRIRDIQFEVGRGELLGLIGPNGAGKSTTIKTVLGLLKDAKADISMAGDPPRYAYVPEQPVYYEDLTLWEHLDLAAAAFGIPDDRFNKEANRLLKRFGMEEARNRLPDGFSKGMKQKLMLMIGFLSEPDLYIVDEPFIGLDPRATRDFLQLLDEEKQRGAGILMSTHVLDTAEKICDSFVLISDGRVASRGKLDDIRSAAGMPGASLFDCFDVLT